MAVSRRTVSLIRSLAIFHIVVGALLIILGIADGVTSLATSGRTFWTGYGFFGVWIGIWMCIAGALGIPGSTPQRTRARNCFAGVFMGFSITSAVLGGIIIICYSIMFVDARYSRYYNIYGYHGYRSYRRYSYSAKMALAAVILTLGIVEFGIGIWVSICLCVMKPCCTDSQQTQGGNAVAQGVDGVPVVIPLQGPGVTFQTQPFYGYPPAGQAAGPMHFQAVGNQPQFVVMPAAGGGFPPQYTEVAPQVPL
ncbi:membrane-spanning 4-domains subfamily A member 4A-like isoform X2 [Acropora muricata]|uniref:membrane-spanning 4-domains subfamily A member 4A-like isoform X2 n=1 Tax=Acropora muricata TaxID=159855 RepID=UPI0034E51277